MLRRNLLKILGSTPLISSLPSLNLLASVDPLTRSSGSSHWGMNAVNLELHYLSPQISKDLSEHNPVIKVIGVGGGGGNAVQHMIESGIEGVEYLYMDTSRQKLKEMNASASTKIGREIIYGLSVKADSNIIKQVAMNGRKHIQESIEGSHMLFIVAGMGGNSGSGLAQAIAQIAHEMGILTIAIVTKPTGTESTKTAEHAIDEIAQYVDSLITIPFGILKPTPEMQANDLSYVTVKGIAELITCPNLVGIDFADIRTVMFEMGTAVTGSGKATGVNRAKEATLAAISSPLLKGIKFEDAQGMIVNISTGRNLSIGELDDVGTIISQIVSSDTNVVIGGYDGLRTMSSGELIATMIVTGLDKERDKTAALTPIVGSEIDYKSLNTPTNSHYLNKKTVSGSIPIKFPEEKESMEYWDIPEFLRR